MSQQISFGFLPAPRASSASVKADEPTRSPKSPKSKKETPDPTLQLFKTSEQQLESVADHSHEAKKEEQPQRVKTVRSLMRSHHRSIGLQSMPPQILQPTAAASPVSGEALKLPKTPRHTLSPISFSPRGERSLEDIKEAITNLSQLAENLHKHLDTVAKLKEEAKSIDTEGWDDRDKEIETLGRRILADELKPQWDLVKKQMDAVFQIQTEKEASVLPKLLTTISFQNLGLERQLDTHLRASLKTAQSSKSFKGERHLAIASEFLSSFLLEFDQGNAFENKGNLRKISQLTPTTGANSSEKVPVETYVFKYIESLILLGELMKHFGLDSEIKLDSHDPFLGHIKRFLKPLRSSKEFKELPLADRTAALNNCFNECGACLIAYGHSLAKRLAEHLKSTPSAARYHPYLTGPFEETIRGFVTIKDCISSFGGDYRRAVLAKFLSLSTDKPDFKPPVITPEVRREGEEYHAYNKELLLFFMLHAGIDVSASSKDLERVNPLTVLQKEKTMERVYSALETEWKEELRTKGADLKMNGIFRLLPILRGFSQSILMGPHASMIALEKFITGKDLSKIVRDPPPVTDKDLKKRLPGQKLDREWKNLHFDFKGDALTISVERIGELEKLPLKGEVVADPTKFAFHNCTIKSKVVIQGSLSDMRDWNTEILIEIHRPKSENINYAFLQRYSALIATLETMGVPYTVIDV